MYRKLSDEKIEDKTYKCKDCGRELREKGNTDKLVDLKLCPQCYTKRMVK